jgi:uncharacterized phage infection (PIP) family protein YhgE
MASSDNSQSLPAGENPPQLKGADDIALEAIAKSSQSSSTQSDTNDIDLVESEADKSDEFAQTLHSLENVIESKATKAMTLKEQIKQKREMVKNVYENDTQYQEATEAREEATQVYKQRRSALEETAQMRSLREEMRGLKEDLKDIEESLSNHLISYHQLTNSTSFDTSDGDQWEFDIKAKVKNKKT